MGNVANSRRTMYQVSWNAYDLGFLDDVNPEKMKMRYEAIKVGSMGNVKLGDRFTGLEDAAAVEIVCRETVRLSFQKMCPWASQTAGAAIDLTPPVGSDLYTYAQALLLHPIDKTGGSPATDNDLSILKTVPIDALLLRRTGNDEDKWSITFLAYPDRSQFPLLKYCTMTA